MIPQVTSTSPGSARSVLATETSPRELPLEEIVNALGHPDAGKSKSFSSHIEKVLTAEYASEVAKKEEVKARDLLQEVLSSIKTDPKYQTDIGRKTADVLTNLASNYPKLEELYNALINSGSDNIEQTLGVNKRNKEKLENQLAVYVEAKNAFLTAQNQIILDIAKENNITFSGDSDKYAQALSFSKAAQKQKPILDGIQEKLETEKTQQHAKSMVAAKNLANEALTLTDQIEKYQKDRIIKQASVIGKGGSYLNFATYVIPLTIAGAAIGAFSTNRLYQGSLQGGLWLGQNLVSTVAQNDWFYYAFAGATMGLVAGCVIGLISYRGANSKLVRDQEKKDASKSKTESDAKPVPTPVLVARPYTQDIDDVKNIWSKVDQIFKLLNPKGDSEMGLLDLKKKYDKVMTVVESIEGTEKKKQSIVGKKRLTEFLSDFNGTVEDFCREIRFHLEKTNYSIEKDKIKGPSSDTKTVEESKLISKIQVLQELISMPQKIDDALKKHHAEWTADINDKPFKIGELREKTEELRQRVDDLNNIIADDEAKVKLLETKHAEAADAFRREFNGK